MTFVPVTTDGQDGGSLWGWFTDSITKIGNAARDSFLCKQYDIGCDWGRGGTQGYGDWADESLPGARGFGDGPRYDYGPRHTPSGWGLGNLSGGQVALVGVAAVAILFLVLKK